MTDDDLKLIEARCMAATAGPWSLDPFAMYVFGRDDHMVAEIRGAGAENAGQRPEGQSELNARFIAYARADVPFLLAEVRRLQTELAEWKEGYAREEAGAAALMKKVEVMNGLMDAPRYSTEAVDELLRVRDSYTYVFGRLQGMDPLLAAFEKVRASREPAK